MYRETQGGGEEEGRRTERRGKANRAGFAMLPDCPLCDDQNGVRCEEVRI